MAIAPFHTKPTQIRATSCSDKVLTFRGSRDWFPRRAVEKSVSARALDQVCGWQGHQDLLLAGRETMHLIYTHLDARNLRFQRVVPVAQKEIIAGFLAWLEKEGNFSKLYDLENALNRKINWRPENPHHPALPDLRLTIETCRQALDPEKRDHDLGEWLFRFAGFRSRRGSRAFLRSDFMQIFHQLLKNKGALNNQDRSLLRLLPDDLTFEMTQCLADLLMQKDDGHVLTGAPGRFALLPIESNTWVHLSLRQKPIAEFALLYLPLDLQWQRRFEEFDKVEHGLEARFQRYGYRDMDLAFYKDAGVFPGSLAFAFLTIFQDGEARIGSIQETQSDIAQHAPKYAPRSLCTDLIPLYLEFFRGQGCQSCLYPTFETINSRSATDDLEDARLRRWQETMTFIYGKPPSGFSENPVRFRRETYYSIRIERS